MSKITGTVAITGKISPVDTLDTYATHESQYGKGGIHSVADSVARDAIPEDRLEVGMLCYVQDEKLYYQYVADTGAGDPGWVEYSGGGGGGSGVKPVDSEEEMESLSPSATPGMIVYRTDEYKYYRWTNVAEESEPESYDWALFDDFVDDSDILYTTTTPTTADVGGIPAGTEFTDEPIINVLDQLLHPYQKPVIETFTLSPNRVEIGTSIDSVTFTWNVTNENNVNLNTVDLVLNGETITLTDEEKKASNTITKSVTTITSQTPTTKTGTLALDDIKDDHITKNASIEFLFPVYHGVASTETITPEEAVALTKNLKTDLKGTYTFSGSGGYEYIIYPSSWPNPTQIKDSGGFTFAYDNLSNITIETDTGVELECKVIRSTNFLNTPEPMVVS